MSVPDVCPVGIEYPRKGLSKIPIDFLTLPAGYLTEIHVWGLDFSKSDDGSQIVLPVEPRNGRPPSDPQDPNSAAVWPGAAFVVVRWKGTLAVDGAAVPSVADGFEQGIQRVLPDGSAEQIVLVGDENTQALLVGFMKNGVLNPFSEVGDVLDSKGQIPLRQIGRGQGNGVALQVLQLDDPSQPLCYTQWPLGAVIVRDTSGPDVHIFSPDDQPHDPSPTQDPFETILLREDWKVVFERRDGVDNVAILLDFDCPDPGSLGGCGHRCFTW